MKPTIGFILLTHSKPNQTIRLVSKLNSMFNSPSIVCHHDFSKSDLPINLLPSNVSLVRPHLQTGWGIFAVVEATIRALQLMYQAPTSPDWFILLSGSDYPIKSAEKILSDLASSSYDVHIGHEQINYNAYERDWQEVCYKRYCVLGLRVLSLSKKLSFTQRYVTLDHPLITSFFLPFSKNFQCFAGEHWFCANRQAANYLIDFHRTKPALAKHYRRLEASSYLPIVPEESYYHTLFCNASHLKVSQNSWRYVDWSTARHHPKTLLIEDLTKIRVSSAHFARKFDTDVDTKVLDELDALIE